MIIPELKMNIINPHHSIESGPEFTLQTAEHLWPDPGAKIYQVFVSQYEILIFLCE